jgi:hypothetical protein
MRSQNEKWLLHKASLLPELWSEPKVYFCRNTYRLCSRSLPVLTSLRQTLFVGNRRRLTMTMLDTLQPLGLAVWFIDAGCKTGRSKKNAYLNTTKLGADGTILAHRYFNEVGFPCAIGVYNSRRRIVFSVAATVALFEAIRHHVPEFMLAKC